MEQEKLTDEQRLCLQMIFDYFHEHGKWPTYSYLERTFHQRHPELDLDEIVESLPPGLSKPLSAYTFSVIGSANEEAILTVPAIYLCQGAVEDLTDFVRSLRFCGERYYSSDKNDRQVPQLSVGFLQSLLKTVGFAFQAGGALLEGRNILEEF